jgi:hypothetical protein
MFVRVMRRELCWPDSLPTQHAKWGKLSVPLSGVANGDWIEGFNDARTAYYGELKRAGRPRVELHLHHDRIELESDEKMSGTEGDKLVDDVDRVVSVANEAAAPAVESANKRQTEATTSGDTRELADGTQTQS